MLQIDGLTAHKPQRNQHCTTPDASSARNTGTRVRVAVCTAISLVVGALIFVKWIGRRYWKACHAAPPPSTLGSTPRRQLYSGNDLRRAVTVEDLRAIAHRRLPRFALEYLEGGAEEEATLRRNSAAFADWRFVPRSLVDVSQCDTSINLFGRRIAFPAAIAPTGLNELFWPHADLCLAEAGIPYVQSTMSNELLEQVACVPGLQHWWQLYIFGPDEIRNTLIQRAQQAGCEALVVTTDAQIYGNREWAQAARHPSVCPHRTSQRRSGSCRGSALSCHRRRQTSFQSS
jgi:hypothetical protein